MKHLITFILLIVITSCATKPIAEDPKYIEIHTSQDIYYVYTDKLYIISESDKYFEYNTYNELVLGVADITSQDTVQAWKDCENTTK